MTVAVRARPASDFDPLALLMAVREVAELADMDEPEQVSTRAWDAARARSERYADAPAARRIGEYLRLSWSKVRELAFMAPASCTVALGYALGARQVDWLTAEYSAAVLTLVARRLSVPTLTSVQYRAERSTMLAADARRRVHGGQLRLPTDGQIATLAGSWDRALAQAGLSPRPPRGGYRARSRAVPILDVLDRCFEHHGTEPTTAELETFARANGIPFPRRERGRPWSDYIREWKERRRANGLPVPDGPPPKPKRPDYARDVGAALPGERRSTKAWDDLDEVIDWVVRYLVGISRGRRASQRDYKAWARNNPGAPWFTAFERHGDWKTVLPLAREELALRRKNGA